MNYMNAAICAMGVAASLLLPDQAAAQRSQDTLRIAINDMFSSIDPYYTPHDEAGSFYRAIYQGLIAFDEYEQKFVPVLASSWKRVDPSTFEFDLRTDIKFHNGNAFNADDVVATVEHITAPSTKIRFKSRYTWAKAEKLGPFKVRISSKTSSSTNFSTLAYRFKFLDAETMKTLSDVSDYGRLTPIATGPYRVVSFDTNDGILVERVANLPEKLREHRAPTRRVHGIPIPDRQTQMAQLLTGGIDVLRNITADDARQMTSNPAFRVTNMPSGNLLYVTLDAAGRSGNALMTDKRIRRAFIQSIPRKAIVEKFVAGGSSAELPKSICFKATTACAPTTEPYKYDPATAKRLLTEAGYPKGVDLRMYAFAPIRQMAEAIAGEARKVGFRMVVEPLPLSVYVKRRGDGDFTAFTGFYPTSAQPDTTNLLDFFFGADRDYWRDASIQEAMKKGEAEFDLQQRTKIYTPALNRINTEAFIFPISELPLVFAHSPDVQILRNPLSRSELRLGDYAWSDYEPT